MAKTPSSGLVYDSPFIGQDTSYLSDSTDEATRKTDNKGKEDKMSEIPRNVIEQLEYEIADLKDRYLRQADEMDKLRKRKDKEVDAIKKYAVSELARDLLPLYDHPQEAMPEIVKILERHGVSSFGEAGEKYEPKHHTMVNQREVPGVEKGLILEVYQVGFWIADRVLRPAVVSVAK